MKVKMNYSSGDSGMRRSRSSMALQPGASSTGGLRRKPGSLGESSYRESSAVGTRRPKVSKGQGVRRTAFSSRGTKKAKVVTGGKPGTGTVRGGRYSAQGKRAGFSAKTFF